MSKKMMIDELYRLPQYERVVVVYQCGCAYYNDGWQSACKSDPLCPVHENQIIAKTREFVRGFRPVNTETKRHTLKID